jgi:hypothetical protein
MDFVTSLPPSKNPNGGENYNSILVIVNRFLKMAQYIPCHKTINAPELAQRMWDSVFSLFGTPNRIVSNRGTVFTSKFWLALCFHLYSRQRLSTAFHPQTNGQIE